MYIGLVGRVFTNRPGDLGSIPGCIIPKTLKKVLDTYLLNTQQYKVHIKGKFESQWVPHSYSLRPHMFSDESNKLKTYTYERMK